MMPMMMKNMAGMMSDEENMPNMENMTFGTIPKGKVNYRMGGPHCHACKFFIEMEMGDEGMGRCKKVAGEIVEHKVCDLFQRKAM